MSDKKVNPRLFGMDRYTIHFVDPKWDDKMGWWVPEEDIPLVNLHRPQEDDAKDQKKESEQPSSQNPQE